MALQEKSGEGAQHDEQPSQDRNITVEEAAVIADGAHHFKSSLWTLSMLRLYGCLFIGYLCATTNGFDGSVIGLVAFDFSKCSN